MNDNVSTATATEHESLWDAVTKDEPVAKTTKKKDPNKPVSFLLRLMPAYKELLESLAETVGDLSLYMEPSEHEERAGSLGEWNVPSNLNQMILHLVDLGLTRIWGPLEEALLNEQEGRAALLPALAWIGQHPDETEVPADLLPKDYCYRPDHTRQRLLKYLAEYDKDIANLETGLAALQAYMAPRTDFDIPPPLLGCDMPTPRSE